MSPTNHAIFLSYASEDLEAAARIADALRAAGLKVWFDKRELRGGEAWDRRIRQQIRDCRLFLAIVSSHTESRDEGYFRREWRLAVERTHHMAEGKAFVVPVVIDGTLESGAAVPAWFREVQWVRLPRGEPTPAFESQIAALVEPSASNNHARAQGTDEARFDSAERERDRSLVGATNEGDRASNDGGSTISEVRTRPILLATLIVLAVLGTGAALWWHRSPPLAALQATTAVGKALAVLPFVDLTPTHDQEYLGDGMAEEILDLLTKLPGLTVIGRTSSFQFKGKSDDLRIVGQKLGASHIVEGSVRTSGSRVRVTAQLIDAQSGAQAWSGSYDGELRDALALQDQVATSIARQLQLVVGSTDAAAARTAYNPEAYSLYLRGRAAFDRGDNSALREAQADFEQALALDPTLTRASEGILLAYLNLVYNQAVPATSGYPRVRTLAEDTLRRDPGSVFAHSALAFVHAYYDYDRSACNRELDAILAQPVGDPVALVYAAWISSVVGRFDEAQRLINQAVVKDPLSPDAYEALGGILRDAGDLNGSERAFRRSMALSPSFPNLHVYIAEILYYRHRYAEALKEATSDESISARQAMVSGLQFALGHKQESDAALAELIRMAGEGDNYWVAVAYTMRADRARAFDWLDKAFATRDLSLHMAVDPMFAPLRDDPRWSALMARFKS